MADPYLMTGLGAALSIFLSATGASLASIPSGTFLLRSECGIRSFAPIVISGVLSIYGTIMAVILVSKMNSDSNGNDNDATATSLDAKDGYRFFAAGLSVGLACLASGVGIAGFVASNLDGSTNAVVEDAADADPAREGLLLRRNANKASPPVASLKYLSVLVFMEAIGLYGLIVGLTIAG